MKVLVACEFSGIVRDAFLARGHDAVSIDILPSEKLGPHIRENICDVMDEVSRGVELMIGFPPCTYLCSSGARWFKERPESQERALDFVRFLMDAPIPRIAIENPIGVISTRIRKPDQIIQPWQFGHGVQKSTCLWLKNLPKLKPTKIVDGRMQAIWLEPPGPKRWMNRSRTFKGVAEAMADQWGSLGQENNFDMALSESWSPYARND